MADADASGISFLSNAITDAWHPIAHAFLFGVCHHRRMPFWVMPSQTLDIPSQTHPLLESVTFSFHLNLSYKVENWQLYAFAWHSHKCCNLDFPSHFKLWLWHIWSTVYMWASKNENSFIHLPFIQYSAKDEVASVHLYPNNLFLTYWPLMADADADAFPFWAVRSLTLAFLGHPITDAFLFETLDHWRLPFWVMPSLTPDGPSLTLPHLESLTLVSTSKTNLQQYLCPI